MADLPVSGSPGAGQVVLCRGGMVLDRVLKRYVLIEFFLGIAVILLGFLFGGSMLSALGACMIGLAAQCSVDSDKHVWVSVTLGLVSILTLVGSGIQAFFHLTSLSRYGDSTSSLTVLLVLAVVILVQNFLALPVEDRSDLEVLRRGISRTVGFSGIGFVGIVLTYLLSYVFYGSAVSALLEGKTVQDFHYLEGVLALAMVLTAGREVLREFLGKRQPNGSMREEIQDETT